MGTHPAKTFASRLVVRAHQTLSGVATRLRHRWMEWLPHLGASGATLADAAATLLVAGRHEAAARLLDAALARLPCPPEPGVRRLQARLATVRGAHGLALSILDKAVAEHPTDTLTQYARASLLSVVGRLAEAESLLARGLTVPMDNGETTSTAGLRLPRPDAPAPDAPLAVARQPGPAFGAPPDPSRPLLFAAASASYVRRFGQAFVASGARHGMAIRLHVVNPDEATQSLLPGLAQSAHVTTEQAALDAWPEPAQRAFFSCARLLALPEVLAAHRAPVVMTDIDQLLLRRPDPALRLPADVALMRMAGQESNFLSLVSATLVVLRPGAGALRFAETVAGVVRAAMAAGPPQWHLDQAALAGTMLGGTGFTWAPLPAGIVHLTPGEPPADSPACFWSITASIAANAAKEDTARFRALAGAPATQV